MKIQDYRQELDGLRALAVFAVIFYHAGLDATGPKWLPGGFLGVDVFFVLSGFLITGILVTRQNLTLLRFYKGRLDRIAPALVLLVAVSCVFSHMFLQPAALVEFADAARGALGFYANYVFMQEDGYVSLASKYKVLLHTWSLGIEWQYYMVFPLLVFTLRSRAAWLLPVTLLLLALLSFGYCLYLLHLDQVQAFYSTPARIWQLFAGGLVFYLGQWLKPGRADGLFSAVGSVLVLFSFLYFQDTDRHPGFVSLIAVLGTALIIAYTRPGTLLYRLLSLRLMVWLGVLSYSLYLYHQPVLVFYRTAYGETDWLHLLLLLPLMLGLAVLSYRLFEEPMRRSRRHVKYLVLTVMIISVLWYLWGIIATSGYPQRQPESMRQALVHFQGPEWTRLQGKEPGAGLDGRPLKSCSSRTPETACRFGEEAPRLVVVGDSFAGVFTYALHERMQTGLLLMHHGECPLLTEPLWFGGQPGCWEVNKQRWQKLSALKPTAVLLAASYLQFDKAKKSLDHYRPDSSNLVEEVAAAQVYASFRQAIERLVQLGHRPLIVLQPPQPTVDIEAQMKRMVAVGQLGFKNEYGAEPTDMVDQRVLRALSGIEQVRFINLNRRLCLDGRCLTFTERGGLFNRGPHLSYVGVQYFLDEILSQVELDQ